MKISACIFLLSLFLSMPSMAQEQEYSFTEKYPLSASGNFGLSTSDGFIHVYPADGNFVEVFYIVQKGDQFLKMSREEMEEKVELEIVSEGDKLNILIRQRDSDRWSNWKNRYNVSCEVHVPVSTSCYIKSSDGDIRLRDLQANQRCKTSDGDISVSNVRGDLVAESSDGDVSVQEITGTLYLQSSDGDLKADNVDGDARFATSDGDIRLYKVNGMIEASTSDGDITFTDCAGTFSGVTSDGDVRGNMTRLKSKLSVVTSDGDIEVVIPEGTAFNLKMKGEDLSIPRMELAGKIDEHTIQGSVNGGGIPVELITSDGHVKLSFR